MRIALDPTTSRLLRDVSAWIRVLQSRDGMDLSESLILERARNIVMGLIGNYRIEALDSGGDKHSDAGTTSVAFDAPASIMGSG